MIKNATIDKVNLQRTPYTPTLLLPLIAAARAGEALEPPVTAIMRELGFDSFMFGMSANPRLDHESRIYAFTTMPLKWVARYDQCAYVEVDPRVLKTLDNPFPLLWDASSERGLDTRTDAFLDDAADHGIASGFAYEFSDTHYVHGLMALNSAKSLLDPALRKTTAERFGEIALLGACFHEIFMKGVIDRGIPPSSLGAPLSPRQRECLELAAHGLSTEDVAFKLNIAVRTAQFHFDCIRSKLGAANRQEAVARGITNGIIKL